MGLRDSAGRISEPSNPAAPLLHLDRYRAQQREQVCAEPSLRDFLPQIDFAGRHDPYIDRELRAAIPWPRASILNEGNERVLDIRGKQVHRLEIERSALGSAQLSATIVVPRSAQQIGRELLWRTNRAVEANERAAGPRSTFVKAVGDEPLPLHVGTEKQHARRPARRRGPGPIMSLLRRATAGDRSHPTKRGTEMPIRSSDEPGTFHGRQAGSSVSLTRRPGHHLLLGKAFPRAFKIAFASASANLTREDASGRSNLGKRWWTTGPSRLCAETGCRIWGGYFAEKNLSPCQECALAAQ